MIALFAATISGVDRPYHHIHPGYFDASALLQDAAPVSSTRERFRRAQTLLRAAATPVAPTPAATVIYPTDFGADPTGETDSSTAFNRSVAALLALAREDHKDTFQLYDLGGATLDLGGGVSSPRRRREDVEPLDRRF